MYPSFFQHLLIPATAFMHFGPTFAAARKVLQIPAKLEWIPRNGKAYDYFFAPVNGHGDDSRLCVREAACLLRDSDCFLCRRA